VAVPVPAPGVRWAGTLPGPRAEAAPPRRDGSIRRSSDVTLTRLPAAGSDTFPATITARARDLLTTADSARVTGTAALQLSVDASGRIASVRQEPAGPSCDALTGKRVGFGMRGGIRGLLTALASTPLGLLVDDLSHVQSPAHYGMLLAAQMGPNGEARQPVEDDRSPGDVCAGLRVGSEFDESRSVTGAIDLSSSAAPSLGGTDALAWHDMPPMLPRQSRRIRRLDVWWRDEECLAIDAMFRDTAMRPDGSERIVHEYSLAGEIDARSMTVTALAADPRVLPFPGDCALAAASTELVVGQPVATLRARVGAVSRGAVSCTHLNDLMRSLADVEALARTLPLPR
jgi:hypothetical protein